MPVPKVLSYNFTKSNQNFFSPSISSGDDYHEARKPWSYVSSKPPMTHPRTHLTGMKISLKCWATSVAKKDDDEDGRYLLESDCRCGGWVSVCQFKEHIHLLRGHLNVEKDCDYDDVMMEMMELNSVSLPPLWSPPLLKAPWSQAMGSHQNPQGHTDQKGCAT